MGVKIGDTEGTTLINVEASGNTTREGVAFSNRTIDCWNNEQSSVVTKGMEARNVHLRDIAVANNKIDGLAIGGNDVSEISISGVRAINNGERGLDLGLGVRRPGQPGRHGGPG